MVSELDDVKRIGRAPAYPLHPQQESRYGEGLTKREAFAMAAMQGLIAADAFRDAETYATRAAICADALLAELAK